MDEEYMKALYQRAIEVQPHINALAQDLSAMGMAQEDVVVELTFAMIHEGYRLRCMEEHVVLRPKERRLQAHIPEKETHEN